ncbi:hypothetical protein B0H13DRAFT_1857559 [Mycena leptocephala]|nr:hypothetical protein B0H13DRAFT_1857559 [Mycena leptocephala]
MSSGRLIIPPRPLGTFSKQNWGDHIEFQQGQAVTITSTSTVAGVVAQLKPKRWEKIVAAAMAASKIKSTPRQPVIDISASDGATSEDFDMIDNDDSDCQYMIMPMIVPVAETSFPVL